MGRGHNIKQYSLRSEDISIGLVLDFYYKVIPKVVSLENDFFCLSWRQLAIVGTDSRSMTFSIRNLTADWLLICRIILLFFGGLKMFYTKGASLLSRRVGHRSMGSKLSPLTSFQVRWHKFNYQPGNKLTLTEELKITTSMYVCVLFYHKFQETVSHISYLLYYLTFLQ